MIQALLREFESLGCAVTAEEGNLKLHDPRFLTIEHKNKIKHVKNKVLELFNQQDRAKRKGWIVYPFGEAYEIKVGRNSTVFMFLERDGNFTVWRGTWRDKDSPEKEKVIVQGVNFDTAFERANKYVDWFRKKR